MIKPTDMSSSKLHSELVENALARVRQGLPAPPEVYEIQHRRRIDWSLFPGWARPVDPDVFEGCCHEG